MASDFEDFTSIEPPDTFYVSRQACLGAMQNKSKSFVNLPYCPPDWDPYMRLCWPPVSPMSKVNLPCPDDNFLNPSQKAFRLCLPRGHWYVNHSFDDNPYTFYDNCFLPGEPTVEADLRKMVGEDILNILKLLESYKKQYLVLHVVAVVLLVASVVLSATMAVKLKNHRQERYTYALVIIASLALLTKNSVTMSVSPVDDATDTLKCRSAKGLLLTSTIIFYESMLGYVLLCITPVLDIKVRPLVANVVAAVGVLAAVSLVVTEISIESFIFPQRLCEVGTLHTWYHWFSTAPKILLILTVLCLDSVAIYGAYCLKLPRLEKGNTVRFIRQGSITALITVIFKTTYEALLLIIYSAAYLKMFSWPIATYVHAFCICHATEGIIFSVLMCFTDLRVMSLCPLGCLTFSKDQSGQSIHDIEELTWTSPAHHSDDDDDNNENVNEKEPADGHSDYDNSNGAQAFPTENGKQPREWKTSVVEQGDAGQVYESKLLVGELKPTA